MKGYGNPKIRNNQMREDMKAKGYVQTFVFIPANRKANIQAVANFCQGTSIAIMMLRVPFMRRARSFGILGFNLVLMPGGA